MPRPAVQIFLAIALAVGFAYFWRGNLDPLPAENAGARDTQIPLHYLDNTRSLSFSEEGKLTDIVEAQRVEQFSHNNQSLISEPRFYAHSEDDRTWSASSRRGTFLHGPEKLLLRDEVVLLHDQSGGRMDTRALNIDLKTRTALSRDRVKITQDDNITRADGLLANLATETITLSPNVESTYVQP